MKVESEIHTVGPYWPCLQLQLLKIQIDLGHVVFVYSPHAVLEQHHRGTLSAQLPCTLVPFPTCRTGPKVHTARKGLVQDTWGRQIWEERCMKMMALMARSLFCSWCTQVCPTLAASRRKKRIIGLWWVFCSAPGEERKSDSDNSHGVPLLSISYERTRLRITERGPKSVV